MEVINGKSGNDVVLILESVADLQFNRLYLFTQVILTVKEKHYGACLSSWWRLKPSLLDAKRIMTLWRIQSGLCKWRRGPGSLSPSVPVTSSRDVWPPGSPWPSGSGRVHFRQQESPGSGPRRRGSWAWPWALDGGQKNEPVSDEREDGRVNIFIRDYQHKRINTAQDGLI